MDRVPGAVGSVVRVERLTKEFRVLRHRSGLWGAVRNLVSREGTVVRAVDGVSFAIESGEFVGYVGPNGAGKSTTIKMLAGILVPTSGLVEVGGLIPHRKRTLNARQIGVVFGQRTQLWWDLPPLDGFRLLGRLYRVERATLERRLEEFTSLLGLERLLETPVRKLSLGEKMRCELVGALLYDPRILFLDEPTIGLDVVAKQQIRMFLQQINREKSTTVLLTSHDLDDIESLCRRVLVIDRGSILHDGSVDSLKRHFGNLRRLVFQLSDPGRAELSLPAGAFVESLREGHLEIGFDADRVTAPEVVRAVMDRFDILDFQLREIEIEDVVRRIYQRDDAG
ncbi:MAG: ATP-binding cassette domain-containing protein [Candidatus Eisenbacteria bacterium]